MGDDFIVTIHALERMEQRFPDLVAGMSDQEIGELVHREVMAALDAGRQSKFAPLEFAPYIARRWVPQKKGASVAWTEDRKRGYALQESEEGLLVTTVLWGVDNDVQTKRILQRR